MSINKKYKSVFTDYNDDGLPIDGLLPFALPYDGQSGEQQALLDEAAAAIDFHGANPWVFIGDWRHFWQFAKSDDRDAAAHMGRAAFMNLIRAARVVE